MAACAVRRAVRTVAAVLPFPVAFPFPFCVPSCAPDTPGCGGFLWVGRQGGRGKMRVGVRCQRVGRQVFLQRDDPCDEAGLCRGCAVHGYLYGQGGGFRRCMPFCPDHLRAACRHHNVVYGIGAAVDMEGDACRIVRVYFSAAGQCDAGDDIRIHPVGIVGRLQFRLRHIFIADDADAQCGEDFIIRYLPAGGAAPCGVSQIRCFKEDGQGQVLVRQAWHFAAQGTAGSLVVERRLRCSHGVVTSAVGEVGDWLDDQLVRTGDQFLKGDTGLVSHKLGGILGAEIPPDCLYACAGSGSADDAGQGSARLGADIGSCIQRQGSASAVLEFTYLSEMQDVTGYVEVA